MIQYALPYSRQHLDLSQLIPPTASCSAPKSVFIHHFLTSVLWFRRGGDTRQPISRVSCQAPDSSLAGVVLEKWDIAALTSWRGIYADDGSRCPLAILLLPLCRSVQSPHIDSIRILLCLPSFSFLSLCHPSCLQKTSGSHLSLEGPLGRNCLSFCSAKFVVTTEQRTGSKKFWVNYFDFCGCPSNFRRCILARHSGCFYPLHPNKELVPLGTALRS